MPPPIPLGTTVAGRYKLVRHVGGGGMGFVYEAEHLALGRSFALKVLRVPADNAELVQRFEREARALARLSTPRVAQVTDFGVEPHIGPFYVMELVDGESLQQRLDREEKLELEEAVDVAADLYEAIADAHDEGIVHRDLKPGNIGMPRRGVVKVKLLDFGLAASIDDAFLTRITQSHQVLGSLPYIAPEQFKGARPDARQDIWACGVVFYELLTGKLPFTAPSTAALMHAILTAPVPRIHEVPEPLTALLDELLDKDPMRRLSDARLIARKIRALNIRSAATLESPSMIPPTQATPAIPNTHESPASAPPTRASVTPATTAPSTPISKRPPAPAAHDPMQAVAVAADDRGYSPSRVAVQRAIDTPRIPTSTPSDPPRGIPLTLAFAVFALGALSLIAAGAVYFARDEAPTSPVVAPVPIASPALEPKDPRDPPEVDAPEPPDPNTEINLDEVTGDDYVPPSERPRTRRPNMRRASMAIDPDDQDVFDEPVAIPAEGPTDSPDPPTMAAPTMSESSTDEPREPARPADSVMDLTRPTMMSTAWDGEPVPF